MTTAQVGRAHVRAWIDENDGRVVSGDVVVRALAVVEKMPWLSAGTRLDWDAIGGVRINLDPKSLDDALVTTRFGSHRLVMLTYGPGEPAIIAPTRLILRSLDELCWTAPGVHYLFGAGNMGAPHEISPMDVAEYANPEYVIVKV